ncbi:hypothetical protein CFP65_1832 [Kitasatospora sp. MMS16-BH015]|uniref:WXG100 family type VII secretion target n=1 Tax=Kitasatospora sp. MMS16-BH015 TaxID=2018025 RepID=UPI000CA37670|nr:hypothetical protein [Kitasatospora sp. MMS16-BH015]AUG76706.1 hypothetical protein CFP65_1832 [Kitasatospora sp. MMS16-BH015]
MAGDSFHIDLDEVESAAKQIRSMLDDLEDPTNHLEAVIKQIKASVYGTDLLGKTLTGGSSSVGGVADHQEQALAGIRTYLTNSAQMAANLLQMVESHRATDGQNSDELHGLIKDGGSGSKPVPPPAPISAPAPGPQDPGYVAPPPPKLDYNHPNPLLNRPGVGGGGSHREI